MNAVTDADRQASFSLGRGIGTPITEKTWFPILAWVTAFASGILLCRCFGLEKDENIRLALTSYMSAPSSSGFAVTVARWLSVCLPDTRSILLIFASGLCIRPVSYILSTSVTVLRGGFTGLALAATIPLLPAIFGGNTVICTMLTCFSQLLSVCAITVASLFAASFAASRKRTAGNIPEAAAPSEKAGPLMRYLFKLCITMGIAAAAGILHLLACRFSGV